jgi:AraC-like DNA-binding protein
VLDLDGVDCRTPAPVHTDPWPAQCLAIVPQTLSVPANWLPVLRQQQVTLLVVPTAHPAVHPQAAAALRLRIRSLRIDIAEAVNNRSNDLFHDSKDVVRALLSDPIGIRSPRHLADTLGISLPELERRCAGLKLNRIEHVLTAIRWLAVEHLVSDGHLTVREAMHSVGIRDKSNFRRQWRRASYLMCANDL